MSLVDNISRTYPKYAISSSLLRLRATPSISNSTGPAALAYTPCGRAPGARHGTMATATALYAYYTFCHCSGSPRGLPTSVRKSCSYNHHREMHTHHCMVQHLTPFYLYKPISKHMSHCRHLLPYNYSSVAAARAHSILQFYQFYHGSGGCRTMVSSSQEH